MFGLNRAGFAWFGFFVYGAVGAFGWAFIRRELERILPLLLWIVPVFAYLEFGSSSLTEYVPMPKSYNYQSLIAVPIVLLTAYGLAALWATKIDRSRAVPKKVALMGLVLALAGTSLYGAYRIKTNFRDDAAPYQVVAEVLQTHPDRTIYVPHDRWALFLNYYLKYETGFQFYQHPKGLGSGRIHYLWEVDDPAALSAAYVVLHDRYLYFGTFIEDEVERVSRLPDFAYNPPDSWRVVEEQRSEPAYNSFVLYEVGG
jgi:hypothetical protein